MTDVLVRDVPEDVVAALDSRASALGLSRSEYLRGRLAQEAVSGPQPVTVVSTHLSFVPFAAARQLRAITRWAATLPAPRLLLGDLNLVGPLPARLTGWRRLATVATFPSPRPRVQLDHALGDGWGTATATASAPPSSISDHRPLVVHLG